jgi:predicted ThiF/HesA family dinucleotide-utilizing enzyme
MLADGGIVTGPTLAMIGEAQARGCNSFDRMGEFGMGGGGTTVNINVNGGDPNAVVQALRTYMRQNGSVPIKISNAF